MSSTTSLLYFATDSVTPPLNFGPIGWIVRTTFGAPDTSYTFTIALMPALLPTAISLIPSGSLEVFTPLA